MLFSYCDSDYPLFPLLSLIQKKKNGITLNYDNQRKLSEATSVGLGSSLFDVKKKHVGYKWLISPCFSKEIMNFNLWTIYKFIKSEAQIALELYKYMKTFK